MLFVNAGWPISTRFTMKTLCPIVFNDLGIRLLEIRLLRSKITKVLPEHGYRLAVLMCAYSKLKQIVSIFESTEGYSFGILAVQCLPI